MMNKYEIQAQIDELKNYLHSLDNTMAAVWDTIYQLEQQLRKDSEALCFKSEACSPIIEVN